MFQITINKTVVLNTNKNDMRTVSITDKRLKTVNQFLKNGYKVFVNIRTYNNINDKKIGKINSTFNIRIKEVEKQGLRSRGYEDRYRVKFVPFTYKELLKDLKPINNSYPYIQGVI